MTPTLARMIMAKGNTLSLPAKWFSIPQCFRYQRMQKGRKREHFQWNMDIIGLKSTIAEAELMAAQCDFLRRVGFKVEGEKPQIAFHVSNRQVLESFLSDLSITGEDFAQTCINIDKRDKIGDEATKNLLCGQGISAEIADKILALLNITGIEALRDFVGEDNPGYQALVSLLTYAESFGISNLISIDLSGVRGLSYYPGTVWELFDTAGSIPRAIAGGGRYDNLLKSLGGSDLPMVGFGFGDVVVTLLLEEKNLLPASPPVATDVIFPMSTHEFALANQMATAMRRKGIQVFVDYSTRRFKQVIKAAEKKGAIRLWTIGETERLNRVVRCNTLGGGQEERSIDEIIQG